MKKCRQKLEELKQQYSILSTHSVQINKKESQKSELQEEEEIEKNSEEANEMKERTQRTKGGRLTVGICTSYLELPLPLFYEDTDNPVFHLKKLQYMKLKNVPVGGQLSVVYNSLAGKRSSQWIETARYKIKDYRSFRKRVLRYVVVC
jgi:hypothetical protein